MNSIKKWLRNKLKTDFSYKELYICQQILD